MKKILIASTALLLIGAHGASAQEKTLTISVYGFAQDAFKELVYDPFEAKCGCKLVVETGNSVERLAKMEATRPIRSWTWRWFPWRTRFPLQGPA